MKPTLEEIKDNYERVLLQLENGHLAGIKRLNCENYYVVEQQDWNLRAVAIELSRGYNRESIYGYNIDRIKFLDTKNELTDFIDCGSESDITDWDWDINNPHNLKFKKGDVVKICKSESRIYYDQMRGRIGTIVDAEHKQYVDDERITYRVRVDDYRNEYQEQGLWVFHDESSLELYNPQCDDQMDAYNYAISINTNWADMLLERNLIDEKYKIGDKNNMNNILEIYEEKQLRKIHKKYDDLEQLIKQTDERYKVWLECTTTLNKLYEEDKICNFTHANINLSEDTKKKLRTIVYDKREEDLRKFYSKKAEVNAQLSMCETYDQKQEILRRYNIINKNGKVNG